MSRYPKFTAFLSNFEGAHLSAAKYHAPHPNLLRTRGAADRVASRVASVDASRPPTPNAIVTASFPHVWTRVKKSGNHCGVALIYLPLSFVGDLKKKMASLHHRVTLSNSHSRVQRAELVHFLLTISTTYSKRIIK